MRREARAVRFKDGMSTIGESANGRWGRSDLLRRAAEEGVTWLEWTVEEGTFTHRGR